jgi:hypothetical protein
VDALGGDQPERAQEGDHGDGHAVIISAELAMAI